MHLDQAGKIESMRKQLGFLTPGTKLELAVWFCMSATAGFCEEIIFRGYLQRQFAAITNSVLAGMLLSAAVFGASHGYEGVGRMVLIGIYGLMFGLLAWWRKQPSSRDDRPCLARRLQRRGPADAEVSCISGIRSMNGDTSSSSQRHAQVMANEQGLARQLSERQVSMIAIGGAIGTGLFLGSALAVRTAGPGVILSYIFAAGITLLLMGCLAEMAVAHPTAGSFGVYADLYLSPWAGFAIRYTYWSAQSIAIGGEAVAAAIYTQWWFPHTPAWAWVLFYSAVLIFVNARSVGAFGEFEYWFSMIKVSAIIVFILLGAAILFGVHQQRPIGLENFRAYGGFLPEGLAGRVAGAGLRYLQLHRLGGDSGHRG